MRERTVWKGDNISDFNICNRALRDSTVPQIGILFLATEFRVLGGPRWYPSQSSLMWLA